MTKIRDIESNLRVSTTVYIHERRGEEKHKCAYLCCLTIIVVVIIIVIIAITGGF
jgi:hypothetical protein